MRHDAARWFVGVRAHNRSFYPAQRKNPKGEVHEDVVMTSEAIENIPKGYRARETYVQVGPDEVEEIFEMAEPNQVECAR